MARDLRDALVVITGASSGIGRAATLAFVEAGSRVVALGRDVGRLEDVRAAAAEPTRVRVDSCDVTDAGSTAEAMRRVLESDGVPDVVVANAGVGLDARFANSTDEDVEAVFATNVFGVYRTVRPFLPGMVRRGSGRVLLISSVVGKRGVPNYSAYSGSKFALHGMAGALRCEVRGTGVSVGLVCPSSTTTGFHDRARSAGPKQNRVRLARHSAESVAAAVLRMARSDRREVVLSLEGKLMAAVEKVAPGVLDFVLSRALVRSGR